jgi:type II secretory pathway predicted ATPase ExeA
MYGEHFGLNSPPFKITPDPQLFYRGAKRGLALEALLYAIKNGEGIIKVVGEVGSGKTMLCRMLEHKLPQSIEIVYIANPHLSPDMILHAIAIEMRLTVTPQCNQLEVMHALQAKLLEKYALNQQVVIFVEEAQAMPLETLEEIRLLSNLETSQHKLLQIVLFGQPELEVNLSVTHIRQLNERITHSFYLSPLTGYDITDYLHFRMKAVGYRGTPVFSPTAVRLLTRASKGLIRRVNILADKALLAAFADDVYYVKPKHVRLAAKDSGFPCPRITLRGYLTIVLLGVILLTLLIEIYPYRQTIWMWFTKHELVQSIVKTMDPVLYERLRATERWLTTAGATHYCIQIMETSGDRTEDLIAFLHKPTIQPLLAQLYVYQTQVGERTFWRVLYGEFGDKASADRTLEILPADLQRNQPFLRTIKSLQ